MYESYEGMRVVRSNSEKPGGIDPHKEFSFSWKDAQGRLMRTCTGWENAETGNGEKEERIYLYADEGVDPCSVQRVISEKTPGDDRWYAIETEFK